MTLPFFYGWVIVVIVMLAGVLGAQDAEGRWQLRLWWKPFVTLIWFGGGLIALGGALSLLGRVKRGRRNARRREEAEW